MNAKPKQDRKSACTGILVLLVNQETNRASLLSWQSRRQTLTALSPPEAEVVALSEALMPAIVVHESCCDIGLDVGQSPQILFVVKTDSLTQLRNESVTTRSMHPASVRALFERGKSQKADGLTKVLAGASMKTFVSDLGLAPLTEAMDQTLHHSRCGIGSDTPVGQGGTLNVDDFTVVGCPSTEEEVCKSTRGSTATRITSRDEGCRDSEEHNSGTVT